MFSPQFKKPLWRQSQFGGVGFARQGYRSEYMTTVCLNMPSQIGKRTAHANKIIYQHIRASWADQTIKCESAHQENCPKAYAEVL